MRPDDEDRDLREAYSALREEDRRHTPDLERLLTRPLPRRRTVPAPWKPILAAAVVLALVAAAALWWLPPPEGVEGDPTAGALLAWRAPTDVLLETPGRSLLGEVPALGGGGFLPPPADGRPKNGGPDAPSTRKENGS